MLEAVCSHRQQLQSPTQTSEETGTRVGLPGAVEEGFVPS